MSSAREYYVKKNYIYCHFPLRAVTFKTLPQTALSLQSYTIIAGHTVPYRSSYTLGRHQVWCWLTVRWPFTTPQATTYVSMQRRSRHTVRRRNKERRREGEFRLGPGLSKGSILQGVGGTYLCFYLCCFISAGLVSFHWLWRQSTNVIAEFPTRSEFYRRPVFGGNAVTTAVLEPVSRCIGRSPLSEPQQKISPARSRDSLLWSATATNCAVTPGSQWTCRTRSCTSVLITVVSPPPPRLSGRALL